MERFRWVLVLWLACFSTAHAEPRVVMQAPPPPTPQPAWIDNPVTARFALWAELERRWQTLEADRSAPGFARDASAVCVQSAALPTEGEGTPGRRARLLEQSCAAALSSLSRCFASEAARGWERGFERLSTALCGEPSTLQRVQQITGADQASAQSVAAALREDALAEEGRALLSLPLCDQVARLRLRWASLSRDEFARSLIRAPNLTVLTRSWAARPAGTARYEHVVAYHLTEAELTLRGAAEADAQDADDPAALADARAAFACLEPRPEARARRIAVERQLRALELASEREADVQPAYESEQSCCKVCHKGYACGDSCVSRSKSCHKGPGCACDG